jgi:Anthrax toxin lethal factor, N- and C-terminal domain
MSRPKLILAIAALALAGVASGPPAAPTWDPVERYTEERVEGWKVLVHKDLATDANRDLRGRTLRLLTDHLYRITRVLPPPALEKVRGIPVWVELAHPRHPCMCYHPSAVWLRTHGMNPEKAGAVEIANCKNFLTWTQQQPWMVLHELAHGYHDKVLGYDDADVRAVYDAAKEAKAYESVLHIDGGKKRHYALTNDKEYFAEASEAYFGTNDFFPFVRAELRQHDPRGFAMIEKAWGVRGPAKE